MMFSSSMLFTGKHAVIIKKYSKTKTNQGEPINYMISNGETNPAPTTIFSSYYACIYAAAALGLLNKKKSGPDPNDPQKEVTANIFGDMFVEHRDELMYLYHLMILSDEELSLTEDERVRKAFSIVPKEKEPLEMEYFKKFIYGGLELLDSSFASCGTYEDIANALGKMMVDYQDIFTQTTSPEA